MNALILAGGESSRMGFDKAFIKIGQASLIGKQLAKLRRIFKKIIIVTNTPHSYKRFKKVKLVRDMLIQRGPLAGIYSGLSSSDAFYNFVFACDMPFLHSGLIKYMILQKKGFDAVVPQLKSGCEALFAIYSKNCLKPVFNILNSPDLKVRNVFPQVKTRFISQKEVEQFGRPEFLFMNLNSPDELCRMPMLLKKQKS